MQMLLMRGRRSSPIPAGALLPADVVIKSAFYRSTSNAVARQIKNESPETSRRTSAPYKVPATISFVRSLAVAVFGKLVRI
jgi:hypothetical protein